jgi:DNA-binding winged helix-turn-helix (wHTH) protein/Tol biopolymer transport system component
VAERTIYTFGDVRVDVGRMAMSRGTAPVALEPKAFDVLVYLLRHRDRLITKDELLDTVWVDTFVTPNVLTRVIAQVRKALGDESREARYIETVAKRGYRFIAPVTVEPDGGSSAAAVAVSSVAVVRPRVGSRHVPAIVIGVGAIVCATALAAIFLRRPSPAEPSIRRITATGNVVDAIISPDGKYLSYVESEAGTQTLYLRQIEGARPIKLASTDIEFWGSAFAPDGKSIFYGLKTTDRRGAALMQIPVLGGMSRRILSGVDSAVTFSPDGSELAFYRADLETGASSIVVARADGTHERTIATKHPPEFLVPGWFATPSWSPDGLSIAAFVRGAIEARLVTFDVASGTERAFPDRYGFGTFTRWAPDGSGIYFVAVPKDGWTTGLGGHIYFQPVPSGPPRLITNDIIEYRNISITSDGLSLVGVGFDSPSQLSVVPYAGGEERLISTAREDGMAGLTWTADSRRILFYRPLQSRDTIWSVPTDGGDPSQIPVEGPARWPAVTPDGHTLLYSGTFGNQSGLWRSAFDGSDRRLIAPLTNYRSVAVPSVSRDGVVYFSAALQGTWSTYRVGLDGGTPRVIAQGLAFAHVSHDGRMLAGRTSTEPGPCLIVDAQSGKTIRTFGETLWSAEWAPDDRAVLFGNGKNLWRQYINGDRPQQVTNFSDLLIFRFALSPDGHTLALTRGPLTRDAYLITSIR